MTIACIGMTHLGIIHLAAFAAKGFKVIGVDKDEQTIQRLQQQDLPISEPGLMDLMTTHAENMAFTSDFNRVKPCELVFIACDVPTDDQGNSDLSVIQDYIQKTLAVLSDTASLVILSQVSPGFTRKILLGLDLPTSRGLSAGSSDVWMPRTSRGTTLDKRLFYQVETLIFGRAVERALYPERYMVGAFSPTQPLPALYDKLLTSFNCPILKMRYESAELAKISINLFLVSSVSTTNTIAEICESIGADWQEIAPALRLDKRIGPHAYLTPGLGIAGGNLERDLNTVIKLGEAYATETGVVSAWLKNARYRRDWVLRCLQQIMPLHVIPSHPPHVIPSHPPHVIPSRYGEGSPVICILGLAYKPDTHSIKNSQSIALIQALKGYAIQTHDPVVLYEGAKQFKTVEAALSGSDVCILMTPWKAYASLNAAILTQYMRGRFVIDPYRVLEDKIDTTHFHYFTLGKAYDAACKA